MGRRVVAAALIAVVTGASGVVRAAEPVAALTADSLRVNVLTFGPGDHPFLKFGHQAIWIHDGDAGTDLVYNFGTFRFDSPRLIVDFLKGRMMYWLSVSTLPAVLDEYERENRDIFVQELRLDPAAKRALQAALIVNARPENRAYKYDYFLDNCSTRVRDAIEAVGGGVRQANRDPGRLTLRGHALRMAAEAVPFYLALDLVLGPLVDRPIDRWGEMFLPQELARGLGRSGTLVSKEAQLFRADRPLPREAPPDWRGRFFLVGLAFGLVVFALGWGARRAWWLRVPFGFLTALWGLVTGFVGSFLVYVWAFTDHVVAHRNQNILLCAPWALALVVLGIGVAFGRPGAIRKASAVATAALGAALLALAFKITPWHQQNGELAAFFVPAWAGFAAALARLRAVTSLGTSRP